MSYRELGEPMGTGFGLWGRGLAYGDGVKGSKNDPLTPSP